jgi:hypothetical protein
LEREAPLRLADDFLAPPPDLRAPAFFLPLFLAPPAFFLAAGRALLALPLPDLLPLEDFETFFDAVFAPPLAADLVAELEPVLLVPVVALRPAGAELLP